MVEMPQLIGFPQDSAVRELESRGLVPSCFMVFNDGSYASGCVVSASVEAGTMAEVGSTVVVYIAADRDVPVSAAPEDPAASPAPAPAESAPSAEEGASSAQQLPE